MVAEERCHPTHAPLEIHCNHGACLNHLTGPNSYARFDCGTSSNNALVSNHSAFQNYGCIFYCAFFSNKASSQICPWPNDCVVPYNGPLDCCLLIDSDAAAYD